MLLAGTRGNPVIPGANSMELCNNQRIYSRWVRDPKPKQPQLLSRPKLDSPFLHKPPHKCGVHKVREIPALLGVLRIISFC